MQTLFIVLLSSVWNALVSENLSMTIIIYVQASMNVHMLKIQAKL